MGHVLCVCAIHLLNDEKILGRVLKTAVTLVNNVKGGFIS